MRGTAIGLGLATIATLVVSIPARAQSGSVCPIVDDEIPVGQEYVITAEPAYVTADDVNVRSGPGTEFDIITQAIAGAYVEMIGQAFDHHCETWLMVRFPLTDLTGWMHSDYIQTQYPRGLWD
jgi:uncharacterized protein YgiM (DUF1202 family)